MVRQHAWGISTLCLTASIFALAMPPAVKAQAPATPPAIRIQPPPAKETASQPSVPAQPAPMPSAPAMPPAMSGNGMTSQSIMYKVTGATERMEMTVTTSRILTLDQKVPQAQVNNPDILELTPLSPNQVQVFAKKPGVTQVNLWGENNHIYTIDVIVFADARELEMLLRTEFPSAALNVRPVAQGVLISGYVDHPGHVSRIIQLAEEYYPKVINNITVGGVQKVVLHTKVMEVSRTKLRNLGIDWSLVTQHTAVASSVSGLLSTFTAKGTVTSGNHTFAFNVVDGGTDFFAVLEALRENSLLRVLAEPDVVAISGRPAHFNVGGEIPVLVPQSLGTVAIEWKPWGTQMDFVPIVLGNGQIRLEVRPRISDVDPSRSVTLDSYTVPGLWVREVETGVEMKAGQTLAIAGLVQDRTESLTRGIPWVGELPYVGAFFRRVHEERNEIELLILVTPELIEAVDPQDLPPCGPGTSTVSPPDVDFFLKGHLEVPACCGVCGGAGCATCGGAAPCSTPGPTVAPGTPEPVPAPYMAPPADSAYRGAASAPAASSARLSQGNAPSRGVSGEYNRVSRQNASANARPAGSNGSLPGLLGPIGYDTVR